MPRHLTLPLYVLASLAAAATLSAQTSSISLLFPFVTNQDGDDTRLILDNLSGDAPSTTAQAGACTFHFFGDAAKGPGPASFTTDSVSAGAQLDISISAVAADFAGYVVADCDFPAAAGRTIIRSGAGQTFYEGDAEVIAKDGAPLAVEVRPLLFSYATNAPGLDTRIVVSNTTLDSLGTGPQIGACRVDYFGENAPASQRSTIIPAGGRLDFTLSAGAPALGVNGAPGFSGYLTITCEFARARGFSAITEGQASAIAGFGLTPEVLNIPIIVFPIEPDPNASPHVSPLLIAHANTRGDYETVLALSNTSLDSLGTAPDSGACTINYHGDGGAPPVAPQILSLNAGDQAVFPLSLGDPARTVGPAPNFRGHLSVSCDFDRARAVALVTARPGVQPLAAFAQTAELLELPRNSAPAPVTHSYVSNQAGEDRVVVLANTSVDGFGTAASSGACVVTYRGSVLGGGAPPDPVVVPLPAGGTRSIVLSRGLPALGVPPAPGFQGYLHSSCDVASTRGADYRIEAPANLAPYCDVDGTPGVNPSDVVALTNRLGESVPLGDPADPDGDALITDADVQYCNGIASPVTPNPPPTEPPPDDPPPTTPPTTPPPPPPATADLRVRVDASLRTVRPQRPLELTVRVTNFGPSTAAEANVVVQLPFALNGVEAPAECTGSGRTYDCALGALGPNVTVELRFNGIVSSSASAQLVGSAIVGSATADPAPKNNTANRIVPLDTQADIAASAYFIPSGQTSGRLTVSVTNRGPARAEGVRLEARLPFDFDLRERPAGCTLASQVLVCGIGALSPGRTKAYLLDVRVAPLAQGPFTTVVTGSATTSDHKPLNNTYQLSAATPQ